MISCVLTGKSFERCPVSTCMYHDEGDCKEVVYSKISSLEADKRVIAILSIYSGRERDIKKAINKIRLGVLAQAFFTYVYEIPVTEITQEKIDNLESRIDEYVPWARRTYRMQDEDVPEFPLVVSTLEKILARVGEFEIQV